MDKKRVAILYVVCLVLMAGWYFARMRLAQTHPEWFPKEQPQTQQTESPGQFASSTQPTTSPSGGIVTASGLRVMGGSDSSVTLGHPPFDEQGQADYPIALTTDARGASVTSVVLNRYRKAVGKNDPYVFQLPDEFNGISHRALSTKFVTINGQTLDLQNVAWKQAESTKESVSYSVEVQDPGGKPLATIEKTYRLKPKTDPTLGYEVQFTQSVHNLTDQPMKVHATFFGPNTPPVENLREIQNVAVGYAAKTEVFAKYETTLGFKLSQGAQSVKKEKEYPMVWSGIVSAYFDAIVRPAVGDPAKSPLADVKAQALREPTPSGDSYVVLSYETSELNVDPGQTLSVPMEVYFGPRARQVLKAPYYAAFPRDYEKTLIIPSSYCGACTWDWLINGLVKLLNFFHLILRDWGLAIIALVLLVRGLLHPITKKSQVQMAKMQKFGPEIQRIKDKYKDDQQEQNRQMMLFYKEHGSTPVLGCLPMFLQMPIWIALWQALQGTFELRQAPFLWGFTWIHDLSAPDRLLHLPFAIDFRFLPHIDAINLLPLLMGVIFWLQMKFQPKPPTVDPQVEAQQKMMQWMMPFIMPLVLYSGPSGLNLYILTSTAIGIWESKRVRDHIKQQEEIEKQGPVIVDAEDTPRGRDGGGDAGGGSGARRKPVGPKPQGGLGGWLANLQNQVEQIQRDAQKKNRKR